MTITQIASLPFFVLAIVFLLGTIAVPLGMGRRPQESDDDITRQTLLSFCAFAFFLMIGALLWR